MNKPDENSIKISLPAQEKKDWAWDISGKKFDLEVSGTMLLDILASTGDAHSENWKFEPESTPKWQARKVNEITHSIGSGKWAVHYVPDPQVDTTIDLAKQVPGKIPRIFIETPEELENPDDAVNSPIMEDDFTANQMANIVSNALNLYAELARRYKEIRKQFAQKNMTESPADRFKAQPLLTSWEYFTNEIIPVVKKQILDLAYNEFQKAQAEAEKDKVPPQDVPSEAEALRASMPETPVQDEPPSPKAVATMLRCLSIIADEYADKIAGPED